MEGRTASWNLRDRHMADTLDALAAHLERRAPRRRDDRVLLDERDHLFGRVAYQQAAARGGDVITRSNDRRIEGALPGPLHDGAAGPRGDGSTTWTIDSSEPHVAAIALQRNGVRR